MRPTRISHRGLYNSNVVYAFVKISEPIRLRPNSEELADQMSRFKRVSGVYILSSADAHLHLSWSTNLERRLKRLLQLSYPGRGHGSEKLGDKIDAVDCWLAGSRLELSLILYNLAKKLYPDRYERFLKLRMPWFLVLTGRDAYPRLDVRNRITALFDEIWGPFPTRASAQEYEQNLLSLFQIRRCTDVLSPDPNHAGCIYGEMNQCLKPCQARVSAEEYEAETARVRAFLHTNGRSALAELSSARDLACEEMRFEEAAFVHKRMEKMKATAALRSPVAAEISRMNGVALTRSKVEGRCTLWPMFEGLWQDAITLDWLSGEALRSRPPSRDFSLDAQLRDLIETRLLAPRTDGDRAEELAIFSRWYHSSWRDGEWFPFRTGADLNYRKLVREVSKMAHSDVAPTS